MCRALELQDRYWEPEPWRTILDILSWFCCPLTAPPPSGDPVGPHREVSERDVWGDLHDRDGMPLLCVRCGEQGGGVPAGQGGEGKGNIKLTMFAQYWEYFQGSRANMFAVYETILPHGQCRTSTINVLYNGWTAEGKAYFSSMPEGTFWAADMKTNNTSGLEDRLKALLDLFILWFWQ